MKVWILFLLCAGIPALVGAEPPSTQYELVWSDEFKGTTLDLTKWVYRDLGPRRDGVNVQECAQLDGEGMLHLVTKKVGDAFHTAMIATQGTYETTFGYFETRVQFQKQRGHWSAFWLQSSALQQGVGDYRKYGTEIDIFEYLVRYPEILHFNLHWDGYGEDHKSEGCKIEDPTLPEGFHTVGLEWTPTHYILYLDGKEVHRTGTAVSHRDQYIILSLEVGEWAGAIAEAPLPDEVLFDYVRVYKKKYFSD